MRSVLSFVTAVAVASAAALQARSEYAIKDSHPVPLQWERVSDAPADHTIKLQIGLKQGNFAELERHLYEVSDPDHERYGLHLSEHEVNELVRPHDLSNELVHDWLHDCGIEPHKLSYSDAGDWITVSLPVKDVEDLLDTKYSVFRHEDGESHLVRTPEYSLPRHLHEHIDTIAPTNMFIRTAPRARIPKIERRGSPLKAVTNANGNLVQFHPAVGSIDAADSGDSIQTACNFTAVTPKCLRTLYGTINYTPKSTATNMVGLNNFLNQTNNRSDVALFLSKYRPEAEATAHEFKIVKIANGANQQTQLSPTELATFLDLEGDLDAETILSITYPTKLTAYNTGGSPPYKPDKQTPTDTNEPYLTWLNYIVGIADKDIPKVISTSYADDEQTVPLSYATRVCQQYARLGARGVSLFFGSGDSGVGANGTCVSNDGKNTKMFIPTFSSGCPYVTSVSATKNYPEVVAFDPENGFAPGGGFSNYFGRPSYQDAAVKNYLSEIGNLYSGLYNKSGRAYPDIAAQGQTFVIAWNGTFYLVDGTSASTPTAASVLTLVNDALIAAGKPVLGFLNPWLYKQGYAGFTDVTSGSAIGCGRAGFPAKKGWDAVTGWGTPNFPKILQTYGIQM